MSRRRTWPLVASLALLAACAGGERTSPPETAPGPEDATPAAGAEAETRTTSWELPHPELGYRAREGRALFLHFCATCHGAEGRGDGFNAFNLDPKPRDLSDPTFQAGKTDADLADVIRIGGGASGLSGAMPPWGRTLTSSEVGNLVTFLRTLPSAASEGDLR